MFERWLSSYPELELLDLDVKPGKRQLREAARLFPMSQALLSPTERALMNCLALLASGDAVRASYIAYEQHRGGTLLPDFDLLAGCFYLADGFSTAALEPLGKCYRTACDEESRLPSPGLATRRLYPTLRILARVAPPLLLPLYPNEYAVGILYSMALLHTAQAGQALETLREMWRAHGINDELKLLGGVAHLQLGDLDAAINALTVQEDTQRDSVEFARRFYLGYARYLRQEYRLAIRELQPALLLVPEVNPHLHARCALLLAECYGKQGLSLSAMRTAGRVHADEIPGWVAEEELKKEGLWVEQLRSMNNDAMERMARADGFTLELPTETPVLVSAKLDIHKNPVDELRPVEMSWVKRRDEEKEIAQLKDAAARGIPLPRPDRALSGEAREVKIAVLRMLQWWPGREEELLHAGPRGRLAHESSGATGHVRFDFCGERPAPNYFLQGERRAQLIGAIAGAALLIGILLYLMRSAVYFRH